MPVLFLNILKVLFIVLLYLFLWQIARAVRANLGPVGSGRSGRRASEIVLIRGGEGKGERVRLRSSGHVIGRSEQADIPIDDPYASEFHARVGLADDAVVVTDLGSTNGTYLNGRRVGNTPTPVRKGDTVQIGKTILEVR